MAGMWTRPGRALLAVGLLLVAACGGPAAVERDSLRPTVRADLSGLAPFGQAQVTTRQNALDAALAAPDTPDTALGQAFGAMGEILLAAGDARTAEPYLRNATRLAPGEMRWHYYLGHALRQLGDPAGAVEALEAARDLSRRDAATLDWLADLYAELGRTDDAAAAAAAAAAIDPAAAAGRAADPLLDGLATLLETAQSAENRAFLAANDGDWATAADEFARAIAIAPADLSLQMNLGTAYVNAGDGGGALRAFLAAERLDPNNAEPQYALGALYLMAGDYRAAIERFDLAAALAPENLAPRLAAADALRQSGRPAASLPLYAEVLETDDTQVGAQFGLGMALVQLERWTEAVEVFLVGMEAFPGDRRFAHASARLLSAAPDPAARDGLLALRLMEGLLAAQPNSIEIGETMAMAMAENGIWVDALNWQEGTLEGARELEFEPEAIAWLEANLARYRRSEPARQPWRQGHAVFQPAGPPIPDLLPE
jgi:tetratricopeptide (TPR) repeat protein